MSAGSSFSDDLDDSLSSNSFDVSSAGENEDESSNGFGNLGKKEERGVGYSKVLVYVFLLVAAAAVGTGAYFFASDNETENFEEEYQTLSDHIVKLLETGIDAVDSGLKDISVSMTAEAVTTEAIWPNVTMSHFRLRTAETVKNSAAETIFTSMFVPKGTEDQFTAYATENQGWLRESLDEQGQTDVVLGDFPTQIYTSSVDGEMLAPVWQVAPLIRNSMDFLLVDLYSIPWFQALAPQAIAGLTAFSKAIDFTTGANFDGKKGGQPGNVLMRPVYSSFAETVDEVRDPAEVVAVVVAAIDWSFFFTDVLPEGRDGFIVTVDEKDGATFSYMIEGYTNKYLGSGYRHNPKYEEYRRTYHAIFVNSDSKSVQFVRETENSELTKEAGFSVNIFPTEELIEDYETNKPIYIMVLVFVVFGLAMLTFVIYDVFVQRRQNTVLSAAQRTTAIVASLFPKNVQERILLDAELQAKNEMETKQIVAPRNRLREFVGGKSAGDHSHEEDMDEDDENQVHQLDTAPIADLFPSATIMFADLVGFTAWSSMRQPSEVFMLLETIYAAFDAIAKSRRVFKVETVGDCYVAVAGLPEARRDHAIVMARFARDCLNKLNNILPFLEEKLGPDTADLGIRVGLHSGPVTAGVLRGERARFQLFGDTVNTTSRIETTGIKNKIHISEETATLLRDAGKGHWIFLREDKVTAKGKGELTTYFLDLKGESAKSSCSGTSDGSEGAIDIAVHSAAKLDQMSIKNATSSKQNQKLERLINWNSDVLAKLLKAIVARREAAKGRPDADSVLNMLETSLAKKTQQGEMVLDEVQEVITLPQFDSSIEKRTKNPDQIDLGSVVLDQLHDYVQAVADLYHDNAFHNFEHVSHVSMSVVKLLSRIVAPDLDEMDEDAGHEKTLHDHTYGITSDPLTQFAVVFSAIIHDTDHQGVPNNILVEENTGVAARYKNKSVAEQNSVQLAWDLLMQERFRELRRMIYTTADEFYHFRRLVVNSVMATDIMDKDLGSARKARWNKAFSDEELDESHDTSVNRKATIVIEHLIQASDVAHTMQHWHVYRKWNTRLFEEMSHAYHSGRSNADPAENWYKGEMGFFDFYIIPLAKKLKNCGVFGVSSDEYLNYALKNRAEWEMKGQEIVAEMVEAIRFNKANVEAPPKFEKMPRRNSAAGNVA